jgi:peptidoglycan hydrolase FlgJ
MTIAAPALSIGANVAGGLFKAIGKGLKGNAKGDDLLAFGNLDPALKAKLAELDPKQAKAIASKSKEFETVFLENMLSHITHGTGEEGPLGDNGTGGENYKAMMVNEYAKSISKSGGIGVANNVMRELIRLQEGAQG